MANALYNKAKQAFLAADIDLESDDIRAILIDTADYTFSAAHQYLSSVGASARVAVSSALSSKTVTDGVFDAADVTWSSVTGDQSEAIVLYKHTGSDATAALIAYLDTFSSGMPVTPNGGNITVAWDNGANKIFALS